PRPRLGRKDEPGARARPVRPITGAGDFSRLDAMRRSDHLDTLRGFALCGLIFANAPALLHLSPIRDARPVPVYTALGYLVDERFFPVFATLFGLSLALMWRTTRERTASPRRVLAQRLIAIGVLGG